MIVENDKLTVAATYMNLTSLVYAPDSFIESYAIDSVIPIGTFNLEYGKNYSRDDENVTTSVYIPKPYTPGAFLINITVCNVANQCSPMQLNYTVVRPYSIGATSATGLNSIVSDPAIRYDRVTII